MIDRYAIVQLGDGPAPAAALAVGSLNELFALLPDNSELEARERELSDREAHCDLLAQQNSQATQFLVECFNQLQACFEPCLELREQQLREDQQRQREEELQAEKDAQAARIKDAMKALATDDTPATRQPSGELHSLAPSQPQHEEQLAAMTHPSEDDDADGQGDLPNELLEDVPAPSGTALTPTSRQLTNRLPASIGLM